MSSPEQWTWVAGYEGLYEVSSFGNVRSVDRVEPCGNFFRKRSGRELTQKVRDYGRREVTLCRDGQQRSRFVHHLVAEVFVAERPAGLILCHKDGNPGNNVPDNLYWGTHAENVRDSVRHGTHVKTRKTHCPRGHPLVAPNLRPGDLTLGKRTCLACSRAASRVAFSKKKGIVLDLQVVSDRYCQKIDSSSV